MFMESTLFRGPKLKVKWANHHITTLKDTLNTFMNTKFYDTSIEKDVEVEGRKSDSPPDKVRVEVTQDPPWSIPLIIGDAVHNLRSALDLAVCEIAEGFGGKVTRNHYFPIGEARENVVGAVKEGAVHGVPCDFKTFLIDEIQPHRGPNDTLWELHRIDILDKHKMIIPTYSMSPLILTEGGQPTGPTVMGTNILITPRRGEVKEQTVFGGMKFQDNYKPMVFIFFDDIATYGFPREDVFLTLHRFARSVSKNLEAMAKEYVALRNRTLPQ